jgi:mgtE-like transporter
VAAAVGVDGLTSPLRLATISILGGLLASAVVLVASVGLVAGAVRYGWDLDNVVAPVVSTLGDVLTLPALWLATFVARIPVVGSSLGALLTLVSVAVFARAAQSRRSVLKRVVRESWPVLSVAALLSTLAGLVLEKRLVTLVAFPALLMLQPAFVSSAGALGGLLSSRTASKLHLGLAIPSVWPHRDVRADAAFTFGLYLPVYVLNGAGAHMVARMLGRTSPGLGTIVGVALLGGAVAVGFALAVTYYGTVAAMRLGVDPDTYGIPMVTSSVDFGGAVALLATAALLGVTAG